MGVKYWLWMRDLDGPLCDDYGKGQEPEDECTPAMMAMDKEEDWRPHLEFWKGEAVHALGFYVEGTDYHFSVKGSLIRWCKQYAPELLGKEYL